jgi:hypothetical protein
MSGGTIQFKKRFRPRTVEIDSKDESVHFFETVALTRSKEKKVRKVIEKADGFDVLTTDEEAMDLILEQIDELIVPKPGKKTKASRILKELWVADEIESADILDFLSDLFTKRRPT